MDDDAAALSRRITKQLEAARLAEEAASRRPAPEHVFARFAREPLDVDGLEQPDRGVEVPAPLEFGRMEQDPPGGRVVGGAHAVIEPLVHRRDAIRFRWKLAAKQLEAVPRVVQEPLAQRCISRGDELVEALDPGAGRLSATRFLVLLPLLGEKSFHVGVLCQEGFGLLAPRFGELRERLLDLTRFEERWFGQSLCLAAERALVDGLRFLADALRLGKALLELALGGGNAAVEGQVRCRDLSGAPTELLHLANRDEQVSETGRDARRIGHAQGGGLCARFIRTRLLAV